MDLLKTAVVDITTMVATCHALKSTPVDGDLALQRKLRGRLRREIKRGTVAYIDTLARTKRGVVDATLLAVCRGAAEQKMAHAIAHENLLNRIMVNEPGSLDGMAAARQDLWRLAHMTIHLRMGMATLRKSGNAADAKHADSFAGRLRRRFRKSLIAYALASLRTKESKGRLIAAARAAALAAIGERGAAEAERLADIEAGGNPAHTVIRLGVAKALFDLALDWQRHESEPTNAML
jgi:hypothetical protein